MTELERVHEVLHKLNKDDYQLVKGYINKQMIKLLCAEGKIQSVHKDKSFYSEQWEKTEKELQFYKTNYELNKP